MTKKSKLNEKAIATLVEYRVALDIKNSIDKLVNQLRNEFTEIVTNHKLVSDKKNFVSPEPPDSTTGVGKSKFSPKASATMAA